MAQHAVGCHVWQLKLAPTAWLCYEALPCQPCCRTDSHSFNREQICSEEAGQEAAGSHPCRGCLSSSGHSPHRANLLQTACTAHAAVAGHPREKHSVLKIPCCTLAGSGLTMGVYLRATWSPLESESAQPANHWAGPFQHNAGQCLGPPGRKASCRYEGSAVKNCCYTVWHMPAWCRCAIFCIGAPCASLTPYGLHPVYFEGGGGCYKWILSPLSGTLHKGIQVRLEQCSGNKDARVLQGSHTLTCMRTCCFLWTYSRCFLFPTWAWHGHAA